MEHETKILLGIGLIIGAGVAGFFVWEEIKGAKIAISTVPTSLTYGDNQQVAVTVTFPAGKTYAVQGAIVGAYKTDTNLVDGHFWTSAAIAQQAGSLYASGQTAQAAAMATNPQDRIATGTGSAKLYTTGRMAQGEVWAFWVSETANQNQLIVNDAIGTNISSLQSPKPILHTI